MHVQNIMVPVNFKEDPFKNLYEPRPCKDSVISFLHVWEITAPIKVKFQSGWRNKSKKFLVATYSMATFLL